MQTADHIAIPLLDGRNGLAQVARIEQDRALIFLTQIATTLDAEINPIPQDAVIASVVVSPSTLTPDQWPVIGYDAVPRIPRYTQLDLANADQTDPAIAEALVNAFHGLFPWDGFPDPDYFAQFLRDPNFRPTLLRLTADFPKPDPA